LSIRSVYLKDCKQNFMWPSMQIKQCPLHNLNIVEDVVILLGCKVFLPEVTCVEKPQLTIIQNIDI